LVTGRTFVEPGTHGVVAQRRGFAAATTSVTVAAGASATARLLFIELPRSSAGGARPALKWVAWGIAGAAAAGGRTFGVSAVDRWNEAERRCPNDMCSANDLHLADDARSAAHISTIAFVASGVALVGGVALWLTEPSTGTHERRAGVT